MRNSAEKNLASNKAEQALQQIRNPEKVLDHAEALRIFQDIFGNDELAGTTLARSTNQVERTTRGIRQIDAIVYLKKDGFAALGRSRQDDLLEGPVGPGGVRTGGLIDTLMAHPAIRVIAEHRGVNVNNPANFKGFCEAEATNFLMNPNVSQEVLKKMTETLATMEKPDAKGLEKLLEQQLSLETEVTTLETKIGTPAAGGAAATGAELDIQNQANLIRGYESELVPPVPPATVPTLNAGIYEQQRLDAEARINTKQGKVDAISDAIADVRKYFRLNPTATNYDPIDPITGVTIVIARGAAAAKYRTWQGLQDTIKTEIEKDKQVIDKINKDKQAVYAKLETLKTS